MIYGNEWIQSIKLIDWEIVEHCRVKTHNVGYTNLYTKARMKESTRKHHSS